MATHIIIHCSRFAEIRHVLENFKTEQIDLHVLIDILADTQQLAC
jgi:hypothetical protein